MTAISIGAVESLAAGEIAADPMKSAWGLVFRHKGSGSKDDPSGLVALSPAGSIQFGYEATGPFFPCYGSSGELKMNGESWSLLPNARLDREWLYEFQDSTGSYAWAWDRSGYLRTMSAAGAQKPWPLPKGFSPSQDNPPEVKFLSDGRPVYGARLADGGDYLMIGAEKRGPLGFLRGFGLCQGARTLWYVYDDPTHPDGRRTMVRVGEKAFGPYPDIHLGFIRVSESGSWACVSVEGGRHSVIHDGKLLGTYPKVGDLAISADGSQVAYAILEGGKERLCNGTETGPALDGIAAIGFGADPRIVWFVAKYQNQVYLSLGKNQVGPFSNILNARLSADGRNVDFSVMNGNDAYFPAGGTTFGPYASVSRKDRPDGGFFWVCTERESKRIRLVTPSGIMSEPCAKYAIGRGGAVLFDGSRIGVFSVPAGK